MDMTLQIRIGDSVTNNQVYLHRQVQLRETRLESQKDGQIQVLALQGKIDIGRRLPRAQGAGTE